MNTAANVHEQNSSPIDKKEIKTGRRSGLIAIHVRPGGDVSKWPSTVEFKASDGGTYFIYWHPGFPSCKFVTVPSAKEVLPLTDVYGENDLVVIPSREGEWITEPNDWDYAHLSDKEIRLIAKDPKFEISNPPEVVREAAAEQFLDELLKAIPHNGKESKASLWSKFQRWNANYDGTPIDDFVASIAVVVPYDEEELREVFDERVGCGEATEIENALHPLPDGTTMHLLASVNTPARTSTEILQRTGAHADSKNNEDKGLSLATRIVNMVSGNREITLFRDEYSVAHAQFPVSCHKEVWPCDSTAFIRWIGSEFYRITKGKTVASRESIKDAVGLLEGRAINECEEHRLFNRIAQTPDAVWYDLADSEWRAVRITQEGWSIETDVPLLFRRFSHLAPQVEPVRGGSVDEVLRFVNITEEDQKILFRVHLVASFLEGWAHPALYVYGTQGSAKSTLSRIDRMLIDPSRIEVVSLTKKEEELAQQLGHHAFLSFDNVSEVTNTVADLLCRAITGGGFSKRELYSNDNDVIRFILSRIAINGINLASNRPDLLERCLLLKLERMKERKSEHKLMTDFELARPRILGAVFDVVAKAMALRPSIEVDELPRMADFALWGCAIAEALGIGQKAFMDAYLRNINHQSSELIDDNTVAMLLRDIVDVHDGMFSCDSPSQLFKAFKDRALDEKIADNRLPANPSTLMRELNRLKTPFEELGYLIEREGRGVTIRKVA